MKYRLRTLFVLTTVVGVLLSLWYWREYLPGTFYRDSSGFPHGTGIEREFYNSGELKGQDWYRAGILTRAVRYRPDGSLVADSTFDTKNGGTSVFLREDGSIKQKTQYRFDPQERMFFAHGKATVYNEDGTVSETIEYRNGVKLEK